MFSISNYEIFLIDRLNVLFCYAAYKLNHTILRADTWECKRVYKILSIHNEWNEMLSTLHCWTDLSFKSTSYQKSLLFLGKNLLLVSPCLHKSTAEVMLTVLSRQAHSNLHRAFQIHTTINKLSKLFTPQIYRVKSMQWWGTGWIHIWKLMISYETKIHIKKQGVAR